MKKQFEFNFMRLQDVGILYTYKVGSRFISNYFQDPKEEINACYIVEDDKLISETQYKLPFEVHSDVLVLYRNPYQKLLSGMIEDFHEGAFVSVNKDEVSFQEFLEYNGEYDLNKLTIDIIKESLNTDEIESTVLMHELLEKSTFETLNPMELYCDMIVKYIKYRLETNTADSKHSKFNNLNLYFLLHTLLEDKGISVKLFDIDNPKLSLAEFLPTFTNHPVNEFVPKKKDFSNDVIKNLIDYKVKTELGNNISNVLDYEFVAYKLLKQDIRNVK